MVSTGDTQKLMRKWWSSLGAEIQAASEAAEELEYIQLACVRMPNATVGTEGRLAPRDDTSQPEQRVRHRLKEPAGRGDRFRELGAGAKPGAQRHAWPHRVYGIQAGHLGVRRGATVDSF